MLALRLSNIPPCPLPPAPPPIKNSYADIQGKGREAALARGESDPELKKRKLTIPIDAESDEEEVNILARKKISNSKGPEERDTDKPKRKKGRQKKILSGKELEERDLERKRKYLEQKRLA